MRKVYLYARFQRFWHWMQALIIFALLFSGMEIHGLFKLMGYEAAFQNAQLLCNGTAGIYTPRLFLVHHHR